MSASERCKICAKVVYRMDPQINLDGSLFHKQCAKCKDCSCQITLSNFNKYELIGQTFLLCKTHYLKRFHEGGVGYLGEEKYKKHNIINEKAKTFSPHKNAAFVEEVVVLKSYKKEIPTSPIPISPISPPISPSVAPPLPPTPILAPIPIDVISIRSSETTLESEAPADKMEEKEVVVVVESDTVPKKEELIKEIPVVEEEHSPREESAAWRLSGPQSPVTKEEIEEVPSPTVEVLETVETVIEVSPVEAEVVSVFLSEPISPTPSAPLSPSDTSLATVEDEDIASPVLIVPTPASAPVSPITTHDSSKRITPIIIPIFIPETEIESSPERLPEPHPEPLPGPRVATEIKTVTETKTIKVPTLAPTSPSSSKINPSDTPQPGTVRSFLKFFSGGSKTSVPLPAPSPSGTGRKNLSPVKKWFISPGRSDPVPSSAVAAPFVPPPADKAPSQNRMSLPVGKSNRSVLSRYSPNGKSTPYSQAVERPVSVAPVRNRLSWIK